MNLLKKRDLFLEVFVGIFIVAYPWTAAGTSIAHFGQEYDLPIPAVGDGYAWMENAQLMVDQHLIIEDLNVLLNLEHTDVSDLAIYLKAPTGQQITLKQTWPLPLREPKQNLTNTGFDDQAQIPLLQGLPPYTGWFQCDLGPSLQAFNGLDAYGTWQLSIYDAYYADTGTLLLWQLEVTHSPEPAAFLYLIMAAYGIRRSRKFQKKPLE